MHGMQPDHVALGIENQRDEAIFADRHFFLENAPAVLDSTRGLHRSVFAHEVNQRAAAA